MSALPRPVAAPTREAQLQTLRAWHAERFTATLPAEQPRPTILATSSTGQTVLLDSVTGEIVEPAKERA